MLGVVVILENRRQGEPVEGRVVLPSGTAENQHSISLKWKKFWKNAEKKAW